MLITSDTWSSEANACERAFYMKQEDASIADSYTVGTHVAFDNKDTSPIAQSQPFIEAFSLGCVVSTRADSARGYHA